MRRVGSILMLVMLLAGCTSAVPPAPTPTPYKPANLLTPRPTPPPAATPTALAARATQTAAPAQTVQTTTPVRPTPSPTPALAGTHVTVTEPLQGLLLDDTLFSPIIGEAYAYRVYLPPDYQQSPLRRYPVVYMLHGNGGNYTEWTDSYLPEQIDRLIVADQIPPLIVVMPDDGETTYFANWDNGPRWGDYITEDVVSTIDERYRTIEKPASRAIGGLSMGGLGALNLALQHPDVFGVVGAHSPSVRLTPDPALWFLTGQNFWDHNPIWLVRNHSGFESLKVWIDVGTDDVWLPNIEATHEALAEAGLHVEWHMFPGPHEAEYWIEHLPDYLRFYAAALTL
jgi:enterochelin esterase-like enzyme